MEKMNEKVTIPPPAYIDESDVESIIKPEKSTFEEPTAKPLPVWQNNVLLRSNRRRLVFGGVVSTIVILAIILGVLGSQGILKKEATQGSYAEADPSHSGVGAYCKLWVYKNVPRMSTDLDDMSNKWCAEGGSNGAEYVALGSPYPDNNNEAVCAGWVTMIKQTTAQLKKALLENKPMSWNCYDWEQVTATATGVSTITTSVGGYPYPSATGSVSIYVAGGAILRAGGVLGALALIVPSFMALVL